MLVARPNVSLRLRRLRDRGFLAVGFECQHFDICNFDICNFDICNFDICNFDICNFDGCNCLGVRFLMSDRRDVILVRRLAYDVVGMQLKAAGGLRRITAPWTSGLDLA
ncbi:MAG: hypothetical protein DWQ08_04685 [Proteobacteria bacterium]|nr:MAG: hypothetical protein DWQ08_04685 [Pseudomonadota bacterium]